MFERRNPPGGDPLSPQTNSELSSFADFSGSDFSGSDFSGSDFSGSDLAGAGLFFQPRFPSDASRPEPQLVRELSRDEDWLARTSARGMRQAEALAVLLEKYGSKEASPAHSRIALDITYAIRKSDKDRLFSALEDFANEKTEKSWDDPVVQKFEMACFRETKRLIAGLREMRHLPWLEMKAALGIESSDK